MYKLVLVLVWVVVFFGGCSAKYELKNHYIPSQKDGFENCVQICEVKKDACQKECERSYQGCLDSAYERAKRVSESAWIEYTDLRRIYLAQKHKFERNNFLIIQRSGMLEDDYDYFDKRCKSTKEKYACQRKSEIFYALQDLKDAKLEKPIEPEKPSFEDILAQQQSKCSRDCGCVDKFDRCYSQCGGEVVPYRFCVQNCD